MTVMALELLAAAVKNAAQNHFPWCLTHDYADPDPHGQQCKAEFGIDFSGATDRDEVQAVSVELVGCPADVENGFQVPFASIGYNGFLGERDIAPWKLVPIAYVLLAAEARSRGQMELAVAFTDAANSVVAAHYAEDDGEEPTAAGTESASAPTRVGVGDWGFINSQVAYVQGGDPDGPILPIEQYRAALAAGGVEHAGGAR